MNNVLANLKENRESLRHIYNMRWCLDIVTRQKLYEPMAVVLQTEKKDGRSTTLLGTTG